VSPVAIVAAILILLAPRGRAAGVAYVGGWVLGLVVALGVVVTVERALEVGSSGGAGTLVDVVLLAVGALLLAYAWRTWQGRRAPGEDDPTPAWMRAFDSVTPARAVGLGALFSGLKPKNLALTFAAATAISEAALPTAGSVAAAGVYVGLGSATVAAPLVAVIVLGDRAGPVLGRWKDRLVANNAAIMSVLLLVFGAILVGKGLSGLG
jgi:hypothetical protein